MKQKISLFSVQGKICMDLLVLFHGFCCPCLTSSVSGTQSVHKVIAEIEAWNVINHNYHNSRCTYLALNLCLSRDSFCCINFDFSDNFVSKNSSQILNFTSWHCNGVNLVSSVIDHYRNTITYHNALCLSLQNFA